MFALFLTSGNQEGSAESGFLSLSRPSCPSPRQTIPVVVSVAVVDVVVVFCLIVVDVDVYANADAVVAGVVVGMAVTLVLVSWLLDLVLSSHGFICSKCSAANDLIVAVADFLVCFFKFFCLC